MLAQRFPGDADARAGATPANPEWKKKSFPMGHRELATISRIFLVGVQYRTMRASGVARWLNCRLLSGAQQISCGSRQLNVSITVPALESRRAFSQTMLRPTSAAQEA